ncbi:MAG: hypothetical protein WCQ47_07020, partial [bacterium]
MQNLTKIVLLLFCAIALLSCGTAHNRESSASPSSISSEESSVTATFTYDDLKATNKILFITFA